MLPEASLSLGRRVVNKWNPWLPPLIETLGGTAAANRRQIAKMIESLLRSVELLTVDIEYKEARVGVCDLSDPNYPALARSLRARKDNIRDTVVSLEALHQETPKAV
jgi:hypothetical protein